MSETHGYIKILPDGSGKRIPHTVMIETTYDNGIMAFVLGDIVTGVTSGLVGTVIKIVGTSVSGELHILIPEPVPATPSFVLGENLQVLGITKAKAANIGYTFYFQQTSISGGTDPNNILEIDTHGAMYTRFSEGSPQFDAFGKLQISNQKIIAEYINQYGIDTDKVSINIEGGGVATHLPLSAGVLFQTGTAAIDKIELVSHYFHPCALGQSRLIEFTNALGDTGKTNLERNWGYGDDFDGVFFQQKDGVFGAMIRSSVSGSIVETFVPQSQWNKDRLTGASGSFNQSKKSYDVTKDNITWIDLQWLGAGTVRFGVVIDGIRIICHQWDHSNSAAVPYMRTATLPIYIEQKNTGITASGSEMRIWCTVVKNEGEFSLQSKDFGHSAADALLTTSATVPLISIRAAENFAGITNRKSIYIQELCIASTASNVVIEIWKNPTPVAAGTWIAAHAASSIEVNDTATFNYTNARKLYSTLVSFSAVSRINLDCVFNAIDEGIRRQFDAIGYDTYVITVRKAQGAGANTTVSAAVNWDEV